MALTTLSKFYYGLNFTDDNNVIDFEEGVTAYAATITAGYYTLETLATEVERTMNGAGSLEYTVTIDRATRVLTIDSSGPFSLLGSSGTNALSSALPLLGFDVTSDLTGQSTYISDSGAGSEYSVQFPLQGYNDPELFQRPIDSSVKKSTSGVVEVITFGVEKRMECEILLITNIPQPVNGVIRNNPNGVEDCLAFMKYAILKAPVEFMSDENNPNDFKIYILDQTESDPGGLGFRLTEEYDKGYPEYFRTGKLTWLLREL